MKIDGKPIWLSGFFYILYTGNFDLESGLPIAIHPSGNECDDWENRDKCVVGWEMKGLPGRAKFLYHEGVNGDDHPVWMVNRTDIPQPGSYTHFHWITRTSTDPRAGNVPAVCDQNNAGQLEAAGAANATCPGWFLEIRAVEEFAFDHGGEIIPVYPGIDNATHINLVTNYDEVSGIEPTRQ